MYNLLTQGVSLMMAIAPLSANMQSSTEMHQQVIDASISQLQGEVAKTFQSDSKLESLQDQLCAFMQELVQNGHVSKLDSDENVRPLFVTTQGAIEQTLARQLQQGEIQNLVGMIHTPTPTTPLCTQGDITEQLVHPSMQNDEKRLYTVRARANTLRDYLEMGGELFVVYPRGGLEKRTVEQQAIYLDTLAQYQEKELHDCQLSTHEMDADMVGATYVFENVKGERYLFAIKASQANAPEDQKTWEMWFGPLSHSEVQERFNRVQEFLAQNQAPTFSN